MKKKSRHPVSWFAPLALLCSTVAFAQATAMPGVTTSTPKAVLQPIVKGAKSCKTHADCPKGYCCWAKDHTCLRKNPPCPTKFMDTTEVDSEAPEVQTRTE